MGSSGDRTIILITVVSLAVIFTMLLLVYRSIITVIVLLLMVGIELQVARGIVAFLGDHGFIGLTTFAVNLLVSIGIAAGTDYGIFFFGRYHEARQAGEDRESAYYTTYHGVAKIVLASGLTIAGALFCLKFTRLPHFQALAIPCALGVIVAVAVALTLVPAVHSYREPFRFIRPQTQNYGTSMAPNRHVDRPLAGAHSPRDISGRTYRALDAAGIQTQLQRPELHSEKYSRRAGIQRGTATFPPSRMLSPEVLMVEADHDLRNSADALVLNKVAKGILAVPGISRVQTLTRPEGTPLAHTSIPFMVGMQNAAQLEIMPFQKERMDDMLKQADEMATMIAVMQRMYGLMQQLVATTHHMVGETHEMQAVTNELRDHVSDFEDMWRPIRSYFYWEKHCYDIPICFSLRSIFDTLDGIDEVTDKLKDLVADLDQLDVIMPQILVTFPTMIETMQSMRTMMLTMHSTMSGILHGDGPGERQLDGYGQGVR